MSVLFQSFKLLLEGINEKGISVATHIGNQVIKFRAAFGIFDLVAKAPILNMNQFNGVNGCPTCLHPGVWTVSRYYLPDFSYPLRTNTSVKKSERDGKVVDGIKGKSVLTGVVDLVNVIPLDYIMHCVLEGVTKWLIEVVWFIQS